jgi:hypothetical protein
MPNFTLVLDNVTTARIRDFNSMFGGSVGGFAAQLVKDLATLPDAQIMTIRRQIAILAEAERKTRLTTLEPERTRK